MRPFLIISLLVGCSFIVGCSSNKDEQISQLKISQLRSGESEYLNLPRAINYEHIATLLDEYMAMENVVFKSGILIPTSGACLSWREAEPKMNDFLSAHKSDRFSSFYRQRFALELLCASDLLTDPSDDALPVVKQYTRILTDEENKSAAVYYVALKRLNNNLPKAEIKDLSRSAVNLAQQAIAESKETRTSLNLDATAKQQYILSEQLCYKYIDLISQLSQ